MNIIKKTDFEKVKEALEKANIPPTYYIIAAPDWKDRFYKIYGIHPDEYEKL